MRAAFLVALAGCNQFYGLEPTVPLEDLGKVTGVYKLRWTENEQNGTPAVREGVYGAGEVIADVVLDDGTRRDVTLNADGTFSFTTANVGQAYSLVLQTTYARNTYQLAATDLVVVDRIAGRADRALVPRSTELIYQVSNRPTGGFNPREEIMTTGIWTRRQVTGLSQIRFDWSTVDEQIQPLGLLDGTKYDDAYYLYFDRAATLTNYRILSWARARGTLVGGQPTTFTANAAALTASTCAHIDVQSKREVDRLTALFPDSAGAIAAWSIDTSPSREFSHFAFAPLAFGLSYIQGADFTSDVDFASPIPGGVVVVDLGLVIKRPEVSAVSIASLVPITASCPATTTIASGIVAVPTSVEIGGVELTKEDQFLTIDRSAPIPIHWQVSPTGRSDIAVVTLFERIDDNTALLRGTTVTLGNQAHLDPADLDRGRRYFVTVSLTMGVPGAATGDFSVFDDATATGMLQPPPFTIAN